MSDWIRAAEIPAASGFYYFEKEFDAPAGASLKASCCGDTLLAYNHGAIV